MRRDPTSAVADPVHEIDSTLCRPVFYEALADGERELRRAFRDVPSRMLQAGVELVSPDRPSGEIYALRRGWALRIRDWPDGRRSVREIHAPGDFVGLDVALRARAGEAVVGVEPVTVKILEARAVAELLQRPNAAIYLAWLLSQAQLRAERRADVIARCQARERAAVMLVELYDRLLRRQLIKTTSFNLPLTQQQMGDYLGLTVVHVNRTLRQLREEKIVYIDRHVVMIRDIARLRQLARGELANPLDPAADRLVLERRNRELASWIEEEGTGVC